MYLRIDIRDLLEVDELAMDTTEYDGIKFDLIVGRDGCGKVVRAIN